jgi:uncharacterized protein involved in exopolysaccharide biosynthesis/Mrp family chromosome partitioning ATPase
MRWKFWQSEDASDSPSTAASAAALTTTHPQKPSQSAAPAGPLGDLDLRVVWKALVRKKAWVIIPTAVAAAASFMIVNLVTPRYKSEARILVEGRENVFLRPNVERLEDRRDLDAEAIASQVQIVLSRDLAREIIKRNKLGERPEFDPVLQGLSPLRAVLALLGVGRDPLKLTAEERVLDSYYERLSVFAIDKSRVIAVEFQSRDPELAARVANSIADGYLAMQQAAKRDQARSAGQWLAGEIEDLRKKVAEAEARVEDFRGKASLFVGTNNTSLSNQQLGEINTQLSNARAQKSDAESRARLIRSMLQSGRPIEASEVLNSEMVRRLSEQRATLRAQLAEQSSTLLDAHPRIKELRAQITDLDRQLRDEAAKLSRSLENDARIAGARAESMGANLDQLKKQAVSTNTQDVQLRALEREAKAQRDLLESYLAKFREATTRENLETGPSDARIISQALVSNSPAYPKKLPIVLIATLATLMLSAGTIVTGELLRMTAPREALAFDRATEPAQADLAATALAPAAVPTQAKIEPRLPFKRADCAEPAQGIEKAAAELRALGESARKITVIGMGDLASTSLTALTLARLMAREANIALVDLSPGSGMLKAVMTDPAAPGLSDLLAGTATFGDIITRDRMSRVQIIGSGTGKVDAAMLQAPRLAVTINALMQVYDHVVLDAGSLDDVPEQLVLARAHAVLVTVSGLDDQVRTVVRNELLGAGFRGVTMLDAASASPVVGKRDQHMAAA